MVMKSI